MTSRNEITGDLITTKGAASDSYRDGWDRIFGKKQPEDKKPKKKKALPKTTAPADQVDQNNK